MFKKFFGKKNDGFYVQLEDEDAKSTPTAKAPAKSVPVATPAAVTAPTPTPAAAVPAAKAEAKPAKTAQKAETPKVEAAPVPVAAKPEPVITNFATDYLIKPSSNSSRRRPGANMRQFMDLARQIDKTQPFKATAADRKPAAEKPTAAERKPAAEKPTEPKSK